MPRAKPLHTSGWLTLADMLHDLGGVSPKRVRMRPRRFTRLPKKFGRRKGRKGKRR
jgi:hypothetical protein